RIDPDHCGMCASRCASDQRCSSTGCQSFAWATADSTEDFRPAVSTTLPSGIYRYRSVNIPSGVRITVRAPGLLQIYARREVIIAGVIDVSGGSGGDSGAPDAATCAGGQGGGGETGNGTAGRDANQIDCGPGGAGGTGAAGSDGVNGRGLCGLGGHN